MRISSVKLTIADELHAIVNLILRSLSVNYGSVYYMPLLLKAGDGDLRLITEPSLLARCVLHAIYRAALISSQITNVDSTASSTSASFIAPKEKLQCFTTIGQDELK